MNIAIVDDMERDRLDTARVVRQCCEEMGTDARLSLYGGSGEFLQAFTQGAFDIVILDIYIDSMDGIQLARHIRETDRQVRLIFVTVTESFALQGYEVQATYYLVKPLQPDKVAQALRCCFSRRVQDSRFIDLKVGRREYRVLLRNILYARKSGNAMMVYTPENVMKVYSSFAELAPRLMADSRFVKCYYGCVVNMEHVHRLSAEGFEMDNGVLIPLRKKSLPAIKAAWLSYEAHLMQEDGA